MGEETFRRIFQNIVQQCIGKGLVKGKRQIIDSTHIVADMAVNSFTRLLKLCRRNVLKDIESQNTGIAEKLGIEELALKEQDRFTSKDEGLQQEIEASRRLLDGITQELRQGNIKPTADVRKDMELLEKAVADRDDGATDRLISPVDTDARTGMKTNKSWFGYKAHILMEEETEIITGVETTPANKPDGSQLKPLIRQQENAYSLKPEEISGDKAYDWGDNLESLNNKNIIGNISLSKQVNRNGADFYNADDFLYDPENNKLMCPAGNMATYCNHVIPNKYQRNKPGYAFQFTPEQCNNCHLKAKCVKSRVGRRVYISYYEPYYRQIKDRMKSEAGRQAYLNRYRVEHKIADLARYCGIRRCRFRGLTRLKFTRF
jgi:hypothetical protein